MQGLSYFEVEHMRYTARIRYELPQIANSAQAMQGLSYFIF